MIKKLDKFILKAFFGPFFLTLSIVIFILLMQFMVGNLRHLIGKDVGLVDFASLIFYFSLVMLPMGLPLAVLLSALMTYGSLGEHSELTAIKSAGVSLIRVLRPVAFTAALIMAMAVYYNDQVLPWANLQAYSLFYDIRTTKMALEFEDGVFYNEIPGFSIRVEKNDKINNKLHHIMIYDHTQKHGNSDLTIAKTGNMYFFNNGSNLALELENGSRFVDVEEQQGRRSGYGKDAYLRDRFDSVKYVFDLESFKPKETDKDRFLAHNMMKDINKMRLDKDSLLRLQDERSERLHTDLKGAYIYQFNYEITGDTTLKSAWEMRQVRKNQQEKSKKKIQLTEVADEVSEDVSKGQLNDPDRQRKRTEREEQRALKKAYLKQRQEEDRQTDEDDQASQDGKPQIRNPKPVLISLEGDTTKQDSVLTLVSRQEKRIDELKESQKDSIHRADSLPSAQVLNSALQNVRRAKTIVEGRIRKQENDQHFLNNLEIHLQRRYADAVAVFIMFLIGAPLGAIIKKGGLGVPVIISVVFFVIYYILTMMGKKYAEEMVWTPWFGVWMANGLLLLIGLFFLRQARNDARLFDLDYYKVAMSNLVDRIRKPKKIDVQGS